MTVWQAPPLTHLAMYSPVGLRLLDDVTGEAPFGAVRAALDIADGPGWMETGIKAVITASGVVVYPRLGRTSNPAAAPVRTYRVRLDFDYYRPAYRRSADGVTFVVHPYDDAHPPAAYPQVADDLSLLPAPNYPFAGHVPVLRGVVKDPAGAAVADAYVSDGSRERTLTDASGCFGLPLRWTSPGAPTPIDASDRAGRVGTITITVPADLGHSHTIPIA